MPVTGDFGKLEKLITGSKGLGKKTLRAVNAAYALNLQYRTDRCFTGSRDPYGTAWLPITHRIGQPLMDKGPLKNSVTGQYRVTAESVTISSNVVYAATHNYGRGPIPKRQFLPDEARGLPPSYRKDLEDTVRAVLVDEMGGGNP